MKDELKRQWSVVNKQNRKLNPLHCVSYNKQARGDFYFAIACFIIGIFIAGTII